MFDIYDHRILYSPELNGSVNTNYCSLNEHLIIFFMDLYRKREVAEDKIVNLLINVRFYYLSWQRAKIFAQNLELTLLASDVNLNRIKKNDV